jgi:hypothetical protein
MPQRSTFRNHDPPRGYRACGRGGRAGNRDGQRVLLSWPCVSVAPSLRSACVPASGSTWSNRHDHGRTADESRTPGHSACMVVLEFPVVLGEAEELDFAATWPHPGQDRRYLVRCGAWALPLESSERQLRAFFLSTAVVARQPRRQGRPAPLSCLPGSLGTGDPGENGTSSRRWRQKILACTPGA